VEDVGVSPGFWAGRRVLVTGHTGFKGAWLSLWLRELGAEVSGFALAPPTDPSLFERARLAEEVDHREGDVRDPDAVATAVRDARPEVVIHMAAQPLVRASFEDPAATYATNVMGTVHVLDAVRRTGGVRAVVNVTSDKCYENREWLWGYREDEPMGGHDPYSSSKGASELVTASYRAYFFAPGGETSLASARAGNVIGAGDWATDRLVPDIVRAVQAGEPVVVRNPASVRPWQHVLNPLSGYLALAERLWEDAGAADAWNFGPADEDALPVLDIVERLAAGWPGLRHEVAGPAGPHEARFLKLDSSKARALLGWRPRWDLRTALDSIVDWHRRADEGEDARELTLEQIRRFAAS
jgi:CDP-glucose 4,6-dehydratase